MQDFLIKLTETRIVDLTVRAETKADAEMIAKATARASYITNLPADTENVSFNYIDVKNMTAEFHEHEDIEDIEDMDDVVKGIASTMHDSCG